MFFISFNVSALKLWVQKHGGGAGSAQTLPLGSEPSRHIYSPTPGEWIFTGNRQRICGCDRVLGVNPDLQICFFFFFSSMTATSSNLHQWPPAGPKPNSRSCLHGSTFPPSRFPHAPYENRYSAWSGTQILQVRSIVRLSFWILPWSYSKRFCFDS